MTSMLVSGEQQSTARPPDDSLERRVIHARDRMADKRLILAHKFADGAVGGHEPGAQPSIPNDIARRPYRVIEAIWVRVDRGPIGFGDNRWRRARSAVL